MGISDGYQTDPGISISDDAVKMATESYGAGC
jgi:hypothetical protein